MEPLEPSEGETRPAIQGIGLSKVYGSDDNEVVAVDSLDLRVDRGEVFGFLGPNGAGKSTTINMLLGYAEPTAGSASVLGFDAYSESVQLREHIGVLPEGLGLYERLTGMRHLEYAIRWKDASDDPEALLNRVDLSPADARRPVGDYSKGMQQRLALAMALVGKPDLLILDEPSSGLDPHGIRRLREIVREERDRGATVFFSSHILDQVEAVCDRVGILYEGKLVAVDSIQGLRRTVGSGTELLLRIADSVDIDLTAIQGVGDVRYEDGIVRVETNDSTAKAQVVTRLAQSGVPVLDIDSTEASLEDVFTAYTTVSDGERPAESLATRRAEVPAR
jgi:ABC-2 type transport system ATP-binding protein